MVRGTKAVSHAGSQTLVARELWEMAVLGWPHRQREVCSGAGVSLRPTVLQKAELKRWLGPLEPRL